jgi:hypothetical protein
MRLLRLPDNNWITAAACAKCKRDSRCCRPSRPRNRSHTGAMTRMQRGLLHKCRLFGILVSVLCIFTFWPILPVVDCGMCADECLFDPFRVHHLIWLACIRVCVCIGKQAYVCVYKLAFF